MSAPAPERSCAHADSLYGRCVACGMTWSQQAEQQALPRRTPGLAGNEFEQLAPLVEGSPACFECDRFPARLLVTMTETGFLGGTSSTTVKICEHCVGSVALSIPDDVTVVITRLRKDPS